MEKESLKNLVSLAQNGDSAAFSELLRVYEPLISSMVSGAMAKMPGLSEVYAEDLRQEATLAFYSSLVSYDFSISNVEFGLYAKVCICNRLVSQMRIIKRHLQHNAFVYDQEELERAMADSEDPSSRIVEIESERSLWRLISNSLSEYENKVFEMYVSGMSCAEMSSKLGAGEKSVSNAIYRIRKKLKETLKDQIK